MNYKKFFKELHKYKVVAFSAIQNRRYIQYFASSLKTSYTSNPIKCILYMILTTFKPKYMTTTTNNIVVKHCFN